MERRSTTKTKGVETMTQTATKERTLTQIKRHELADGTIVYRFSNDQGVRYITVLHTDGTTGCFNLATEQECKGHQFAYCAGHECYHVLEAQRLELIDPEYEAWKKANGLDQPLTREQYVQANGIYGETVWTGEFFTSPEPVVDQEWLIEAEKRACDATIQAYLDRVVAEEMESAEQSWRQQWSGALGIDVSELTVSEIEELASVYQQSHDYGVFGCERPFVDFGDEDWSQWTASEVA
jgi:hypothetical protein